MFLFELMSLLVETAKVRGGTSDVTIFNSLVRLTVISAPIYFNFQKVYIEWQIKLTAADSISLREDEINFGKADLIFFALQFALTSEI